MKNITFYLLLAILFKLGQTQISITPDDVLNLIGTTHYMAFDTDGESTTTVNIGTAGENQVWDFSALVYPSMVVPFDYIDPAGTPFADTFPEANIAQKMTLTEDTVTAFVYEYLQVSDDSLNFLGGGTFVDNYGILSTEIKDEFSPMPLTYQTTWSLLLEDTIFFPGGYFYDYDDIEIIIDAWGTVTIPAGTFECLRLHSKWTNIKHQVIYDQIISSDTSIGASVSWISKNSMELVNFNFEFPDGIPQYTQAEEVNICQEIITGLEEKEIDQNIDYLLGQNYPNPFNPRTTIPFTLPQNQHVRIEIFTITGEKLYTLVDSDLPPGVHHANFDASKISSGVYIYKMTTGQYVNLKKMVVLK